MENFTYQNPTKLVFGKDVVDQVGKESIHYGKKALILIGKGSVKSSGLYDRISTHLDAAGISYVTYEGIKSNPLYNNADEAVSLAKEFQAEMIIAVGGGSVIDSAKAVAMGYYVNHSVWDFYLHKTKPEKALPIIAVLTLAATGTEMNPFTVLQNNAEESKRGFGHELLYPKVSFLDPVLTFSVPQSYTSYGVADLIAHCLETFFGQGDAPLSDHTIASIIRLAIKYGKIVYNDPTDYDSRGNIMWLATNALNGTLALGKQNGDWACHAIEHSLSALFDIAHGAGLSIVFPAWMKYNQRYLQSRLAFLAKYVFDVNEENEALAAYEFIHKLEEFFTSIGTPIRLQEAQIDELQKDKIVDNLNRYKANGLHIKLDETAREKIVDLMYA
ncbi:iron-containing alcohol dehydrogenase [Solitalea canadensis]|nr:iron-containing alcohol dehydrogenase [Solitalea canadensis]